MIRSQPAWRACCSRAAAFAALPVAAGLRSACLLHLAAPADSLDEVGAAKNAKVLTDQRLRKVEGLDQLVDAPLALGELGDQGYPYWGGESPKELARLGVSVVQLRLSHMRILAYSNSLTQVAERPVCDALVG